MLHIMLLNLQTVLLFICLAIETFEKIFMHHFSIGCIMVYHTIIILNILDKVAAYIEIRMVKD